MAREVLEAGEGDKEDAGGADELMSTDSSAIELGRHSVWTIDRIKDHTIKIGSGITPNGGAASYLESGVPLLRSQNVHFDGLRLDDVAFIGEDTHAEMAGTQLQPGDVLLNITGASIGRCTFVPEGFGEGNVNQHVCIIRPSSKIDHSYLAYCLSAPWGQDQIFSSFTGASRQGLGQRDLGGIQVPVPPLPEQQRITAYLDASCAAIDAAVAAIQRQISILDKLQSVMIAKAVTHGVDESVKLKGSGILELGPIPAHWRQTKLRYEISVRSGDFASDKLEDNGKYPVIGGNGEMGRAAGYNVDGEIVVVGRVGAYCGNAHYVKGRAWVSDNALIVESNHDKRFLTHLIRTLDFNSTAKKTAQPLVTGTQIKNTYVGMPNVEEQEKIVAFIEKKKLLFASLRETLSRQVAVLTTYRKSLIHECVTGQRRVTEAEVTRSGGGSRREGQES